MGERANLVPIAVPDIGWKILELDSKKGVF